VLWLSERGIPAWRILPNSAWLDEDDVHLSAYTAFGVLGLTAQPAAPALVELLHSDDTNVQDYAAAILSVIADKQATKTAQPSGLSQ
jgi:HEAT repeat protein